MKTPSIKILDAKPSKKNPNAKYRIEYEAKNNESLADAETFNDVKAVKTHIIAMRNCVVVTAFSTDVSFRIPVDHTKEQKFAKSGFAIAAPAPKKTKKVTNK